MSDEFGDYEPEDAWDPGDPVPEQLTNLIRRAELLQRVRDRRLDSDDQREVLDALVEVVAAARQRRGLDDATVRRVDLLEEDIVFIMGRI